MKLRWYRHGGDLKYDFFSTKDDRYSIAGLAPFYDLYVVVGVADSICVEQDVDLQFAKARAQKIEDATEKLRAFAEAGGTGEPYDFDALIDDLFVVLSLFGDER